jgi:hypothetical protein
VKQAAARSQTDLKVRRHGCCVNGNWGPGARLAGDVHGRESRREAGPSAPSAGKAPAPLAAATAKPAAHHQQSDRTACTPFRWWEAHGAGTRRGRWQPMLSRPPSANKCGCCPPHPTPPHHGMPSLLHTISSRTGQPALRSGGGPWRRLPQGPLAAHAFAPTSPNHAAGCNLPPPAHWGAPTEALPLPASLSARQATNLLSAFACKSRTGAVSHSQSVLLRFPCHQRVS